MTKGLWSHYASFDEVLNQLGIAIPLPRVVCLVILPRTELDEGAGVHDTPMATDLDLEPHPICAHTGRRSGAEGRKRYGGCAAFVQRAYLRLTDTAASRHVLFFLSR